MELNASTKVFLLNQPSKFSLIITSFVVVGDSRTIPCQTPECYETTAMIGAKMNFSADPCNDFYNFACGGRYEYFQGLRLLSKFGYEICCAVLTFDVTYKTIMVETEERNSCTVQTQPAMQSTEKKTFYFN